jgi:hypothetical protein
MYMNWRPAKFIQPAQHTLDAASGQRNTGIRTTIIDIYRISILSGGCTARKDYVVDIPKALVWLRGSKKPVISPQQAGFWIFQVKQGEAKAVKSP